MILTERMGALRHSVVSLCGTYTCFSALIFDLRSSFKEFSFLFGKVFIIVLARYTIVAFQKCTYINRPGLSLVYVAPGERGRLGEKLARYRA